jgi:DNA-binding MarR family transcriptional regulator
VTPAGRKVLRRGHEVTARLDDEMLAGLNSRERQQLLALLLRIVQGDPELVRLISAGAIA